MKLCISGILLLIFLICISGCTGTSNPPVQAPIGTDTNQMQMNESESTGDENTLSFDEEIAVLQNQTDSKPPVNLRIGEKTQITLKENPTTGYSWNVSVTDGLIIVNDFFIGPENKRIVGAGGEHVWVLEAVGIGEQTFIGVYRRSWEPPSDVDTRYIQEYFVI